MKRLMIASVILFVFSIPVYAQMSMMGEQKAEMKPCGMMMGEGQQMPIMKMMMDMMKMQEKMMMGAKASEKKQMMKEMSQMKKKMQKMVSMRMGMTGMDNSQSKIKCAEQSLKKAIALHELHMKDPKTITEASQIELMDQIKKAYDCITGTGSEMSGTPSKEVENKEPQKAEPSKNDLHKH